MKQKKNTNWQRKTQTN